VSTPNSIPDADVVVVGAGPAGLVAAAGIADAGYRVVVVERQASVGEHVRTSGATAISTVERFGVPAGLYHRLERLRISAPARTVRFECGDNGLCVLDVRGVYRWLASRAEAAGARILLSAVADRPLLAGSTVEGCFVRVGDSTELVRAHVLVDAGGHRAQMSKQAGLHAGFTRFGVGAEYELVAPRVDQDELVLILSERHAPSGYAWAFPWGEERVRLGVGVHHTDVRTSPRALLEELRRDARSFDLDLTGAEIREFHYGLVPASPVAARLAGDGIVAVGDAAGQATLVVGEGIRIAMIAGEMAGESIVAALHDGQVDSAALASYERRFRAEFERDLRVGHALNRRLSRYGDDEWNDRLRFLESMPPRLVIDLLQSQAQLADLVPWIIRHPAQWRRAGPLARALLSARR
jgi:digeranylgeranylglycerophospholipid reductase